MLRLCRHRSSLVQTQLRGTTRERIVLLDRHLTRLPAVAGSRTQLSTPLELSHCLLAPRVDDRTSTALRTGSIAR